MDSAHMGVIYFNFGTVLRLDKIPKHTMKVFLNVFDRLEQKVVMKWINNDTKEFPENFFVDYWLPQLDILSDNFFLHYICIVLSFKIYFPQSIQIVNSL